MNEIELKLQVPPSARAAFDTAVAGRTPTRRMRLQAAYFDTAGRDLAEAGLALRLRREGRQWVQTLKGAAEDGMTRTEHDVPRGGGAALPPVDPALHAETGAGDRLGKLLGGLPADSLSVRYRTDIARRTRRLIVRMAGRPQASVELAFDIGRIFAGDATLPVCEFEIELVAGSPRAVVEVARRWMPRHGLWLDTRTKAERGDRLARGQSMSPARLATAVRLDRHMTWADARQAILRSCADQILANASQIASGEHGADHVHQLRVGLRRLRSALDLFDVPSSVTEPGAPLPGTGSGALIAGARCLFRALGAARDEAVIEGEFNAEMTKAMRTAGVPVGRLVPQVGQSSSPPAPVELLRQPAHQNLLLDLLDTLQPNEVTSAAASTALAAASDIDIPPIAVAVPQVAKLRTLLSARLDRWHAQVVRDARRYGRLDDRQRHRLRKRAKRLRYAAEFSAGLFKTKAARRYLKVLRALQERLGAVSDVLMAMQTFGQRGPADPQAMFALGWLAAHRERLLVSAGPELKAIAKVDRFWKSG